MKLPVLSGRQVAALKKRAKNATVASRCRITELVLAKTTGYPAPLG